MHGMTVARIDEVILHILDPHGPRKQVLSAAPLPPDSDARIFRYFKDQIEESLKDAQVRRARFADLEAPAATLCRGLLEGGIQLVEGSQRLAQRLYEIMAGNRSISTGDLAVCRFRGVQQSREDDYLALLKIDPSEALRRTTGTDRRGRPLVTFEVESDVLPTAGERLQKCAFVRPLAPRPADYDLLLLDRQKRADEVAQFFSGRFLEAVPAPSPEQQTRDLYRGLLAAKNKVQGRLGPRQVDRLDQFIEGIMNDELVHVDERIQGLNLPPAIKAEIGETVSASVSERIIAIDRPYADKVTRRRRFRGEAGLKVEMSTEGYPRVLPQPPRWVQPAAGPGYYEIVLRSETWEEIA
jgi:37-kD nucleoid-associated bacterial protein